MFFKIVFPVLLSGLNILAFDINDPKTNLDSFVRVSGSKDYHQSTMTYINGTVMMKIPGQPTFTAMLFEGFNTNRKVHQGNGSYLSLSREFLVYRDIHTGDILQIYSNPLSGKPNEVFPVANDPVNGEFRLGDLFPSLRIGSQICFDVDVPLNYPNPMSPTVYPKYSAAPVYSGAELFTYFTDYQKLANTHTDSVPIVATWSRTSQFLPWLEMGQTPGSHFYSAFAWKCDTCLPDDLKEFIHYLGNDKYLTAPTRYKVPNQTSWRHFKSVIDSRRAKHQPDIQLPVINITNPHVKSPYLDARIVQLLSSGRNFQIKFNGSAMTLIYAKDSPVLFRVVGNASVITLVNDASETNYLTVQTNISGQFYDINSNEIIRSFVNPITNKTVTLPLINGKAQTVFSRQNLTSMLFQELNSVGLLASYADSKTGDFEKESWLTSLSNIVFNLTPSEDEIVGGYGTVTWYSSWPKWLNVPDTVDGILMTKLHVLIAN